ncbi:MAG: hypothetical protein KY459_04370 [Acidobacteria bacterium]|nr:hypothetical protein [Acidobacteriota bacterium]
MRNRLKILVVLLVAGSCAATAATDRAPITVQSIVEEINLRRVGEGLPPLRADERLHLAAMDRIEDMEDRVYWGHRHPIEGGSPFVWLHPRGYLYRTAGENLAAGFETAEVLVDSWMASPGHRDNILSPLFEDVGVAEIDGGTIGRLNGKSIVVLFASEKR